MADPYAGYRSIIEKAYRAVHREEKLSGFRALTFSDLVKQSIEDGKKRVQDAQKTSNGIQALAAQVKATPPGVPFVSEEDNIFGALFLLREAHFVIHGRWPVSVS